MDKQQRMEELQQILSQPVGGEAELRDIAGRRQQLMRAVGALEDRKRSQHVIRTRALPSCANQAPSTSAHPAHSHLCSHLCSQVAAERAGR